MKFCPCARPASFKASMICPICSDVAVSSRVTTGPPEVRCGKLPGVGGTYAGPRDITIAAERWSALTRRRAIDVQRRSNVLDRLALRRRRKRIFAAATYRRRSSSRCSMAAPSRFGTADAAAPSRFGTADAGPPGRAGDTLTLPTVAGDRGGAGRGVGAPAGATIVGASTPPVDDRLFTPPVMGPANDSRPS